MLLLAEESDPLVLAAWKACEALAATIPKESQAKHVGPLKEALAGGLGIHQLGGNMYISILTGGSHAQHSNIPAVDLRLSCYLSASISLTTFSAPFCVGLIACCALAGAKEKERRKRRGGPLHLKGLVLPPKALAPFVPIYLQGVLQVSRGLWT